MARLVFTAQCGRLLAANARFPAWPLCRRQLTPAVDGRLAGGRRRRLRYGNGGGGGCGCGKGASGT